MLYLKSRLITALTLFYSVSIHNVYALPSSHLTTAEELTSIAVRGTKQPEWLRIMPLGASIVRGLKSTPEDGFRKALRDDLRSQGFLVNMVGSRFNVNGSMQDGNHEGHAGHRIDQVIVNLDLSNKTKPNVYLINAGTNDCQQNYRDMKGTIGRMENLTVKAWRLSPKSTIILSTVLPSNNTSKPPGANERVDKLNVKIRELASKLKKDGKRIVLAEMNNGAITISDLGPDKIHPTNAGYIKMANIWNKAIGEALKSDMIQAPEDNGTPDQSLDGTCDGGKPSDQSQQITPSYLTLKGRDAIKSWGFAQLVNHGGSKDSKAGMDDLVGWKQVNNKLSIEYRVNKGSGHFDDPITVDLPFDCPTNDIRWADMNGDHLDDYICVASNGDLRLGINSGLDSDKKVSFKEIQVDTPKHEGYDGKNVRLSDIDGDCRADYCVIGTDGVTKCWKNTGSGDEVKEWEDMGSLFKAQGTGDVGSVRYVDINGDARADWVVVDDKGQTDIWTNRQCDGSKVPCWDHAKPLKGGEVASRVRNQVHFARILAKKGLGHGRRDYVYFEAEDQSKGNDGDWKFWIRAWKNDETSTSKRNEPCGTGHN